MAGIAAKKLVLIIGVAALPWSLVAQARAKLQCNKQQTQCTTESTRLTIGDRVGVFNDEGEMVASGEVMAMRGEKRAVKIGKRHGRIKGDDRLALLDRGTKSDADAGPSYKYYREPSELAIGVTSGMGSMSVGDSAPALEFSAYGQYKLLGGLKGIGRVVYQAVEGEVTRYGDYEGTETSPFSMTGYGVLGGVAYIARENKPTSIRGELGLGLMNVAASIEGAQGLDEKTTGYTTHLENGLALYGRGSLGAMFNFGDWHLTLDGGWGIVHNTNTTVIAAGLLKDLK